MRRLKRSPAARRFSDRRGFTLTEVLVALAIAVLISVAVAVGVPAAAQVYREVTTQSEADILRDTLVKAISDELRFATSPKADGSFTSSYFGPNVSLSVNNAGQVTVGGYPLLSSGAYSKGLTASLSNEYTGGVFQVALAISDSDGEEVVSVDFAVRPLNS